MRWSAGVFVALIGLILVVGPACRDVPTENTDRNRAPETYLTAAPADSIANGGLVRVPHRFRAQWSGSDIDGEVVGFYVAVTETTVENTQGTPFRLPPPKPSQYVFTTKKDSLFTFSVLEGRGNDRQHGLYVFAVDNQGRVDPTPAVTHFVARDQNLPGVIFTDAHWEGQIFLPAPGGGVMPVQRSGTLTDGKEVPPHVPTDTIPTGSQLHFAWRGFDPDFGSSIIAYHYKLTETDYVRVDSTVTSASYGTGFGASPDPVPVGLRIFRVRAQDEAGGTTQPDSLRQFVVNFGPDTWFAGPYPSDLAANLLTDSLGTYFPLDANGNPIPFPGNPLTDTLMTFPADRKVTDGMSGRPNKTFVEIRTLLDKTLRYYVRSEGDTVAFGSGMYFRFGGSDKDSPYTPRGGVNSDHPDSILFKAGPANGSPVGFQVKIFARAAGGGGQDLPFTTVFPNANFLDPFYNPSINFTFREVRSTGLTYLFGRAVDGDRAVDGRIGSNLETVVLNAERACGCSSAGSDPAVSPPVGCDFEGTDTEACRIRSKIIVIPTNFRPGMLLVSPQAEEVLNPAGNRVSVIVRCTDPDPDPTNPGGAQYRGMFFAIRGRIYPAGTTPGGDEGWQDPLRANGEVPDPAFVPYTRPLQIDLDVPPTFPDGPAIIEIEVQDNATRSLARVINVPVHVYWRVGP